MQSCGDGHEASDTPFLRRVGCNVGMGGQASRQDVQTAVLPPTALTIEDIDLACDVGGVLDLFEVLARKIARHRTDVVDVLCRRFARRHARHSFALGGGAVLARTTLSHLSGPRAAYVRCVRPLPIDAPDGQPVTEALALVVPHPALTAEHDLLHSVQSMLCRPQALARLRASADAEGIVALLAPSDVCPRP